ncbi:hypothetical protein QJQ45_007687 [Haematococcus lacustris]|nr:hypothetical protein QJQ45_007687 [Haematococcus lacustris]
MRPDLPRLPGLPAKDKSHKDKAHMDKDMAQMDDDMDKDKAHMGAPSLVAMASLVYALGSNLAITSSSPEWDGGPCSGCSNNVAWQGAHRDAQLGNTKKLDVTAMQRRFDHQSHFFSQASFPPADAESSLSMALA